MDHAPVQCDVHVSVFTARVPMTFASIQTDQRAIKEKQWKTKPDKTTGGTRNCVPVSTKGRCHRTTYQNAFDPARKRYGVPLLSIPMQSQKFSAPPRPQRKENLTVGDAGLSHVESARVCVFICVCVSIRECKSVRRTRARAFPGKRRPQHEQSSKLTHHHCRY